MLACSGAAFRELPLSVTCHHYLDGLIGGLDEVLNQLSAVSVASPRSPGKHACALRLQFRPTAVGDYLCSRLVPEDTLAPLCISLSIAASLHNVMLHCGDSVTTSRLCKQQTHEASLKRGFSGAAQWPVISAPTVTKTNSVLASSFSKLWRNQLAGHRGIVNKYQPGSLHYH